MINKTVVKFFLGLTLIILLGYIFSDILTYFVISLVLTSILKPLTNRISNTQFFKFSIPRFIAVLFSFMIFIGVVSIFIILFIPVVSDQIEVLSNVNYEGLLENASNPIRNVEEFLISYNLTDQDKGFLVNDLKSNVVNFIQELNIGNIINTVISFTGSFFIGIIAVIFITFFLLYETDGMRKRLISIIPNKYFEVTISALNKIEKLFSNYLLGLLLQMLGIFTIASIGLSIVGIKYATTIALFAAVANLIPYLGPLLGATFGIIVGISTTAFLEGTQDYALIIVKIISVFVVVQVTDNLVFQPFIFSKSVKAHPLEIFVVIFAGATIGKMLVGSMLGGMLGMIAAIPVYTILKVSTIELYSGYKEYRVFRD